MASKIPLLSRHGKNTAYTTTNKSELESSLSPKAATGAIFGRSNTQGGLKQQILSNEINFPDHNLNSEQSFAENLNRAQSEISLLRKELQMKNNELLKLKKLSKIQDKCKTPQTQVESESPSKVARGAKRSKVKSRLTTGDNRNKNIIDNFERSASPSDEYYETAKISPTSSYSNSVYSKGLGNIKSSQSCRNVEPDVSSQGKIINKL